MQPQLIDRNKPELSLQEVVQRILMSGRITATERLWFHEIIATDMTLDSEMMLKIRQVFERVQMGLIKIVD